MWTKRISILYRLPHTGPSPFMAVTGYSLSLQEKKKRGGISLLLKNLSDV